MSRVEIDWSDLGHAFESGSFEVRFYLDRQTGKVLTLTDEALRYAKTPPTTALPDWLHESVREAMQVLDDRDGRYIEVPSADSHEEYRDMEAFISTVTDPRLQDGLWRAIRGSGAFRRFKDTLQGNPSERQRWFAFRDARTLARMNDWLASQGVEPLNPLQPPT